MSDAMLKELADRCPNLHKLAFVKTNLSNVSALSLPKTLHFLEIQASIIPLRWFQFTIENKSLVNLQHLNLKESTKLNNADLKDISNFVKLKTLNISGCYRVTEDGLKTIATSLTQLEQLSICETACTDLVLHLFARNLQELRSLHMKKCRAITEAGIAAMATGLIKLEELRLDSCSEVKDSTLPHLQSLKHLRYVSLIGTNVSKDALENFQANVNLDCKVVGNY